MRSSCTAVLTRASLGTPRPLKFRDDIMLQDRIAAGEQSIARILLGGKAVVTVRERSVVTITESPKVSTIDVRTPNAVAGIRGTS